MMEINYMNIGEFADDGYLQEVNRRFFHPLGLALEVNTHEDGSKTLGGIWDYRESPTGVYFADSITKLEKFKSRAERFDELFQKKLLERYNLLGYGIQEPYKGDDENV
jgi:hypothetical protein